MCADADYVSFPSIISEVFGEVISLCFKHWSTDNSVTVTSLFEALEKSFVNVRPRSFSHTSSTAALSVRVTRVVGIAACMIVMTALPTSSVYMPFCTL